MLIAKGKQEFTKYNLIFRNNSIVNVNKREITIKNAQYTQKPKFFYNLLENQQQMMDEAYKKLKLNNLEDWCTVKKDKFSKIGLKTILYEYYAADKKKLLISIYPNYPWEFGISSMTTWEYFQSIDNQRQFLDDLFNKFQLKTIDDWLEVPKREIIQNGGKNLFCIYSNDIERMFSTIYPSHKWIFPTKIPLEIYFRSLNNQREFMNKLFIKLNLKSLDDWLHIPNRKIYRSGGRILLKIYSNDKKKLLSTIFPDHIWDFENLKISSKIKYFNSIENQRKFMNNLYLKFGLNSLDDWIQISRRKLLKNRGKVLLVYYYENDIQKLLSSIYPDHHWNFINLNQEKRSKTSSSPFKSIEGQQIFMDNLYKIFGLNSLEEWKNIQIVQIIREGGESLISYYYANNMKNLFKKVYPNYPWEFEDKINSHHYFSTIEKRQSFMDNFFNLMNYKTLDDLLMISKRKFNESGGYSILNTYYNNDLKKLLRSIYPNYPWKFEDLKGNTNLYFKSIENQRKYMDKLFYILNLKSFKDWHKVSRSHYIKNRGISLLDYYYSNDIELLLRNIYPNYPWCFSIQQNNFDSIEKQRNFLDKLFIRLNLNSLDDWHKVKNKTIILNDGHKLLRIYGGDKLKLFKTIYPNIEWRFTSNIKQEKKIKSNEMDQHRKNLYYLLTQFSINCKKDWYRLPIRYDINIVLTLKKIYPEEKWKRKLFSIRTKKVNQLMLYTITKSLFPTVHIFEDYHHPYLQSDRVPQAYDIFFPSLNLALEYQGAQHYDDIPSVFPNTELCRIRDQQKIDLSREYNIKIVYIPYWWDKTRSSLISSLIESLPNFIFLSE